MTRPGRSLLALFCAALVLAAAPGANGTATPGADARRGTKATAAAKSQARTVTTSAPHGAVLKTTTKGATKATAGRQAKTSPEPKAAAKPSVVRTPARTAAPKKKSAPATPAGDRVAADGIVETECYRLMRGKGRCEPQCLPYTRCRSGISSCRTGHENGPVTWFNCEQARGNTSLDPAYGRVLVLGRNAHNMSTGHTLYVEQAQPRGNGRYELMLSHTNYDRRCNLETNMRAEYDPITKTIDVRSGKWVQWGRDLKVAGFIHN